MKNISHRLPVAAAFLLLARILLAANSPTELPFTLYRGYAIVVQGAIGKLERLNFLIDTGAGITVLDRKIAQKLRLVGTAEQLSVYNEKVPTEMAVLPALRLGPIRAESLPVVVMDLSFIERGLGLRVDAMIGMDVLQRTSFSIDYQSNRLSFGSGDAHGPAIPFETDPVLIVVPILIQGQPVRLMVDTGAKDLILFEERVHNLLPGLHITGDKTWTTMRGSLPLKRGEVQIRLGEEDLGRREALLMRSPAENLPSFDGLLGVASLGLKRIQFDFDRKMIRWKK